MKASDPPWGSPPNAYELLKVEIEFFVQNYFDKSGQLPTNDAMQVEACRIIFAAEAAASTHFANTDVTPGFSWLRDLIMSSPELARKARFGPIRTSTESRHSPLRINGQVDLFAQCPLEVQLHAFATVQQALALSLDEGQCQNEACEIVRRMEKDSAMKSDIFANWVVKGIYSGTDWLANFKQRAGVLDGARGVGSATDTSLGLEWEQQWPQTMLAPFSDSTMNAAHAFLEASVPSGTSSTFVGDAFALPTQPTTLGVTLPTPTANFDQPCRPKTLLPEDTNFFRCFERDIKRWVAATMVSFTHEMNTRHGLTWYLLLVSEEPELSHSVRRRDTAPGEVDHVWWR